MADYRFKIQGENAPFLVQFTGGTDIRETLVEYSGDSTNECFQPSNGYTCAVLSRLCPNTTYNMKITDCVGNTVSQSFGTCSSPSPPAPAIVNLNMLGTVYNPVACVEVINSPKYLEIDPPLTTGQCMRVCFCGCANDGSLDTALIEVFKSCNGGAYSRFLCVEDDDDDCYADLGPGDCVCYSLSAVLDHTQGTQSYSCACAMLCIDQVVNLVNIDGVTCDNTSLTVQETCCTTTTTTTTATSPQTVYWQRPLYGGGAGECQTVLSKLVVDPPMTAGQSFRLCFYNCTYWCFGNFVISPLCSCAYNLNGTTKITNTDSSIEPFRLFGGPCSDYQVKNLGYIDVTAANVGNIKGCLIATSCVDNLDYAYEVKSCSRLSDISNAVGGTFNLTNTPPNGGVRTISATVGSLGSGLPLGETTDSTTRSLRELDGGAALPEFDDAV